MKLDVRNIYDWPLSTRLIIVGVIALIVFLFGYWWDLSALRGETAEGQKQEEDLKLQMESSISREKKLNQELANYPEMQALLVGWKKKIIKHSQLPPLLNDILKIGAGNHLYFTLFNPEQETVEGEYRKLPIKVIAVGTYHQIGDFFSQVANLPWLVEVGDFVISNETKEEFLGAKLAEQAKAQNLLTTEMTLQVYHYPDPNELVIIKSDKSTDKPAAQTPGSSGAPAASPTTTPPATTPQSETTNAPKI